MLDIEVEKRVEITFILSLTSFLILTTLVISGLTQAIDEAILELLTFTTPGSITHIFSLLTLMGNTLFLIAVSLLFTAILYRADQSKLAYHFAGMMLLTGLAVVVLKYSIGRSRPTLEGVHYIVYGYPSGHTTGAFTFFIGAYLFYFVLYKEKHDIFYLSLSLVVPSLVAISRLVLGVHYLTDVIAGVLLSGIIVTSFWMKMESDWKISSGPKV